MPFIDILTDSSPSYNKIMGKVLLYNSATHLLGIYDMPATSKASITNKSNK